MHAEVVGSTEEWSQLKGRLQGYQVAEAGSPNPPLVSSGPSLVPTIEMFRQGSIQPGFESHTLTQLQRQASGSLFESYSALKRQASGNLYEGFSCVRVGSIVLPSSMDLRNFLDEVQFDGTRFLLQTPEDSEAQAEPGAGANLGGGAGVLGGQSHFVGMHNEVYGKVHLNVLLSFLVVLCSVARLIALHFDMYHQFLPHSDRRANCLQRLRSLEDPSWSQPWNLYRRQKQACTLAAASLSRRRGQCLWLQKLHLSFVTSVASLQQVPRTLPHTTEAGSTSGGLQPWNQVTFSIYQPSVLQNIVTKAVTSHTLHELGAPVESKMQCAHRRSGYISCTPLKLMADLWSVILSGEAAGPKGPLYCALCCLTCRSPEHLQLHMCGRTHLRRVRIAELQANQVQQPQWALGTSAAAESASSSASSPHTPPLAQAADRRAPAQVGQAVTLCLPALAVDVLPRYYCVESIDGRVGALSPLEA